MYPTPEALLAAYNLAQAQAILYFTDKMNVKLESDYCHAIRYSHLSQLVNEADHLPGGGLSIAFSGDVTDLRDTTRYGVPLARFLPALLDCRKWTATASIQVKGRGRYLFQLDQDCGLTSGREKPEEFHSGVEAAFAADWGQEPRDGWTLLRDFPPPFFGQKVVAPDFLLRHESGREMYFEIVGFWTKEYLTAKIAKMSLLPQDALIIAAPEKTDLQSLSASVIRYDKAPSAADVQAIL